MDDLEIPIDDAVHNLEGLRLETAKGEDLQSSIIVALKARMAVS